ncbi:glycine betaine ABC transporter substrate-binding protein [Fonticella tunisiensis]|uniref:Osmoprotectant transport system permease protein n=1 Tax=Fonticella tunisiensis TaxID=1096341 RepID=A0A4R7KRT3_9CLOT|nr:glycine betaine ABC transporter substrate-binding protein [Fonticella tunisiensis]TDT61333.1 osmoprotectant transport system permease protein [Fonticella tunisiensis]
MLKEFLDFVLSRQDQILKLLSEHITLTIFAVLLSILIGIPLGILITRIKKLSGPVIGAANIVQAIPSLALLGFLIPFLGIGSKPAIVMVFLYSLLPIIKNTYTGLTNINPDMLEASRAMGMTGSQILRMVQLPLALPIIMTGIRISAVTAVGLMTIAAFVGAGGLGYMVFSGVQTVNNYMILAGAIPACILALLMDFIIGKVEGVVTPQGIKTGDRYSKTKKSSHIPKKVSAAIAGGLAIILIAGILTSIGGKKDTIVIGSKDFNEQLILGNMMAILIEENTDLKVEKKLNLGGTNVVFSALKTGDVDLYVEYTGTGLVNIMQHDVVNDPDEAYNIVKEYFDKNYNLKWLKPLGFNNTYTLAVTKETAKKYSLETFSDLAKVSDKLILGSTIEFSTRPDGYPGLKEAYNMNFGDVKAVNGGLRYTAINSGKSHVIDAFATDGLLKAFDLKVLKDDKQFFPPYFAAPLVRKDTLNKHPEIEGILNKLSGLINDDVMRDLNYRVDKLNEKPEDVARNFLKEKGLIK